MKKSNYVKINKLGLDMNILKLACLKFLSKIIHSAYHFCCFLKKLVHLLSTIKF